MVRSFHLCRLSFNSFSFGVPLSELQNTNSAGHCLVVEHRTARVYRSKPNSMHMQNPSQYIKILPYVPMAKCTLARPQYVLRQHSSSLSDGD